MCVCVCWVYDKMIFDKLSLLSLESVYCVVWIDLLPVSVFIELRLGTLIFWYCGKPVKITELVFEMKCVFLKKKFGICKNPGVFHLSQGHNAIF